jgi:hypothetical protein
MQFCAAYGIGYRNTLTFGQNIGHIYKNAVIAESLYFLGKPQAIFLRRGNLQTTHNSI